MSACCDCGSAANKTEVSPRYRRILWAALAINLTMFGIECSSGWQAGSASLLADAIDFFGDAANYALSLVVLSMALTWRSRAALVKGMTMGAFGLYVLGQAGWNALYGGTPEPLTMGVVGVLALVANVAVAVMLYRYREGDANMRSVWLCSRNDAIGNIAVVLAAVGVNLTGAAWPDVGVAAVMGLLGLTGAYSVVRQARLEINAEARAPSQAGATGPVKVS